jgi:hypothetical protein
MFGYRIVRQCPSSTIDVCNLASFCGCSQPRNRLHRQSVRQRSVRAVELFVIRE